MSNLQATGSFYGFIYFKGEGLSNGKFNQAPETGSGPSKTAVVVTPAPTVSNTNSPVSRNVVNGGRPVLTSTFRTEGLRDPFIIRDPSGSKFYVIAMDLKIFGGAVSWDQAGRQGSLSLVIWDLKTWSAQRLVKGFSRHGTHTAGMTWAPEAWDPTIKKFVMYWTSNLYAVSDTIHTGTTYPHIMFATTTNFVTLSTAQVWIDPGVSIIDTIVAFDPLQ
ncbi:hypothetical protein MVEN_00447700 [Mycena venus]|uniref:Uncharacterized protein n=1 Tax=Mycena venus TaxID=2733690 RepID=A0A8H7D828_9AGAR|nr:hypothetical protein MVEN_00447700 [Mycena venus]